MSARSELPDYVERIIRKSGIRRLSGMEMFHVHLLAECLRAHGIECRSLMRAGLFSEQLSKNMTLPKVRICALEIQSDVYGINGARGWDDIARRRQRVKNASDNLFVPAWEGVPREYHRGPLFAQGEPQLRRAVDEVMANRNADLLDHSTPSLGPVILHRPRF